MKRPNHRPVRILRALTVLLAALALTPPAKAQGDVDALRYSLLQHGSSARALGAGGAFGALGGDFGALSINPAGLGVYRSSELSFGPTFESSLQDARYLGQVTGENRSSLGVGSSGLVLTGQNEELRRAGSLRRVSSSFAFGVNRLADFHNTLRYTGTNPDNALLGTWTDFLNADGGTPPADAYDADPFGAGLGWEAFLINPDPTDSLGYVSVLPDGGAEQERIVETRGALTEMLVGYGVNLGNRLYIGGSIGIPFLRYTETSTWTERDALGTIAGFEGYAYRQRLQTSGSGLNAKLGLIALPHPNVRLGAAVHSPTRFRLTDTYSAEVASNLDTAAYDAFSPEGLFTYNLGTPWRVVGSAAVLWPAVGFFSVDYEYLDYGYARYDFRGFANDAERSTNDLIAGKYRSAHVLRAGAEFKLDRMRLRAGYQLTASPFSADRVPASGDLAAQTFTGGIGYRGDAWFIDLAYAHRLSDVQDVPYLPLDPAEPAPVATVDRVDGQVALTMGLRF
jgi:hypothetical protein